MNDQAESLNRMIGSSHPALLEMLSRRGKNIYFPYKGILGQGTEAKHTQYNATLGLAKEDDGSTMHLSYFDSLSLSPEMTLNYAPSFGQKSLRELWKEKIYQKNPSLKDKKVSLPVVTQALTHGLSVAAFLFLDEGDEIIVPQPCWDNYSLVFEEAYGAKITGFPYFCENIFNIEGFRSCLEAEESEKLVFLFNSPNNPTGYTPTWDEAYELAELFKGAAERGKKIVLIHDDAYFGLVYDKDILTESLFSLLANAHENLLCIKVDGVTKEDYAWGLRVGFLTFGVKNGDETLYQALEDKAAGVVRATISNCSQLSQSVALKALTSYDYNKEKENKYNILKSRYHALKQEIRQHPEYEAYFQSVPFNSGYFMCFEITASLDAEEVRKLLIEKYETGVIVFGSLMRIAYSCVPKDSLPELLHRLYQGCKDIEKKHK